VNDSDNPDSIRPYPEKYAVGKAFEQSPPGVPVHDRKAEWILLDSRESLFDDL